MLRQSADFTTMRKRLQEELVRATADLGVCPQCGREGVMNPSVEHGSIIVHRQAIEGGRIVPVDFCSVRANEGKTRLIGVSSFKDGRRV